MKREKDCLGNFLSQINHIVRDGIELDDESEHGGRMKCYDNYKNDNRIENDDEEQERQQKSQTSSPK
jgi:hypothetical protein